MLHWIPVNVHAALKKFPFLVTIALSFGRVWAIRVDANFFENGEKKISLFNHKRRRISRETLRTQAFLAIYNTQKNCWTINASVNSTCAQPPPPGLLRGICPPCQSRGGGICKFCTARGPGICQPPGHSRAFDRYAVSYQNLTTQKVLLEKKQIGSSVKDRNKL